MAYAWIGFIILSVIVTKMEKNRKSIIKCPSYLILIFLTYAAIDYGIASIAGVGDFDDNYKWVSRISWFLSIVISLLAIYFVKNKFQSNKVVKIMSSVLPKISVLAVAFWLLIYMRDLMGGFNLAFLELCTYVYGMIFGLSVLITLLLYRREAVFKRLNDKFQIVDASVTITFLLVCIMAVGSSGQTSYIRLVIYIFLFVLLCLFIFEKKKLYLDFSAEKQSVLKQYKTNIMWLLPSILLFAIMFFCENSLEFYSVNINTLPFGVGSFYIDFVRIAIALVIGVCGLFALIRENYVRKVSVFIFSVDLAIYVQVMFLNHNLGQTDLEKINWSEYIPSMVLGVVIWGACLIGLSVLYRKHEKIIGQIGKNGAYFLLALQLVSIVYMFISIGGWSGDLSKDAAKKNLTGFYYLTDEDCYTISDENVVVFILDTFSNDYIDTLLKHDSDALADFHDFTYYSNYNGSYDGTPLAMSYLLSGQKFNNTISCVTSTKNAFESEHASYFYNTLKDNQIDARLYTDSMTQSWLGIGNLTDYYSNVEYDQDTAYEVYYDAILKMMVKSVLYRVVPTVAKPYFLVVTDDFTDTIGGGQSQKSNVPNQEEFENYIKTKGITRDEKGKSFIVYHFEGMHDAATQSEDEVVSLGKQNLKLVAEYMEQLKKIGVYDSTTIIVTADHGIHETIDGIQAMFMIKKANQEGEQYIENTAPIDAVDFMPTVLSCMNQKIPDDFGTSVFDVDENAIRERSVYVRKYNAKLLNNAKTANTTIGSTFNCLYEFDYTGNKEDLRKRDESKPDQILKLTDFWW